MDGKEKRTTSNATEKCKHALLLNTEDDTEIPYWDCVRCGAVAFFNPETQRMLIPRES